MKSSKFRIRNPQAVFALLALLGSVGTVHATNPLLSATPSSISVYCSATNPGYPVTVTLKAAGSAPTSPNTYPVSLASTPLAGVTVTPPASTAITASNNAAGINYTFTPSAACTAGSFTYTFRVAATTSGQPAADVQVPVTVVNTYFLAPTKTQVMLTCVGGVAGSAVAVTLNAANPVPAGSTLTPAALTGTPVGFTVSAGTGTTVTTTAGIVYTFTPLAACTTASAPFQSATYTFKVATTLTTAAVDLPITVVTVASSTSTLYTPAVTLNCTYNGTSYGTAPSQAIAVTSSLPIPTSYTVTTTGLPTWISSISSAGAQPTPGSNTIAVASGCGGFPGGSSNKVNVHLTSSTINANTGGGKDSTFWADYILVVTLNIVSPAKLSVTSPVSINYTQKSGVPGTALVPVTVSSGPQLIFTVDSTSLPVWLTCDTTSATTPFSIRFTTTAAADQEAPGPYSQAVRLKVSGQADTLLTINIQINSPSATVKVTSLPASGTAANWTQGNNTFPSATLTLVSSGGAVPYSITTSGVLTPAGTAIAADLASGLAYSFGVQIPVTFSPAAFTTAQPGTTLNGMATIVWGSPAVTTVVQFMVNVNAPNPTLTAIWPSSLPTAAPGTTAPPLTLTGTGFVKSANPSLQTQVGIVVAGAYTTSTYLNVTVTDTSHISLAITVPPAGTTSLPFDTATNANVTLSVCNPGGGACAVTPGSTAFFTIGSLPSISEITSASAFIPETTVAPYDIISLFGYNFCPTCTSSQVMLGTPDTYLVYPQSLSDGRPNPKNLTVTFTEAASPNATAQAPLLFGTNSQINLLVPGVLAGYSGNVNIVVTAGGVQSTAYVVTVNAADPGIFTVGSDGQGAGAILSQSYALVNASNPAAVRQGTSDSVQIYMSGLGAPWPGVANNATGATAGNAITNNHWSGDCISTSGYLGLLNNLATTPYSSIDGAVIQSSLLSSSRLAPCLGHNVTSPSITATVNGVNAPVTYAGWVMDSVEGLYQVNVTLPTSNALSLTTGQVVSLPIVVAVGGVGGYTSQASGVTIAVVPTLNMAAPTLPTNLASPIGTPWPSTNSSYKVVATGGAPNYTYALAQTSGPLPLGLTFNSDGSISGTPALGTSGNYSLTVIASDTATPPVTGTVSFTITVTGGLAMTASGAPFTGTAGVANASLTTIIPTGGASSTYTFTLVSTQNSNAVTGLSIDANTGVVKIGTSAVAGVYPMVAQATDTTTPTALTGNYYFTITIALAMPTPTPTAQLVGSGSTLATAAATGNAGTVHYTLDAASVTYGFAIGQTSGILTVHNAQAVQNWPITVTATDTTTMAAGASGFGSATVNFNVTVLLPQTITFASLSGKTYGAAPFTVSATSTSGLTVSFTSATTSVCTASGANGTTVTILSAGTCTIDANQAGNGAYAPATVVPEGFTVSPEAQTITFTGPGNQTGTGTVTLSATASSGLTVTFSTSSLSSICTVSGTTLTPVGDGSCVLLADQTGGGNYQAAPEVSVTITISGI